MFERSAQLYFEAICSVGAGKNDVESVISGTGCQLSDTYVLTARHVWADKVADFEWPVIHRYDGLWRCESAWESVPLDTLLLRVTDRLVADTKSPPKVFPALASSAARLGMPVAYVSYLRLKHSGDDYDLHRCFCPSAIAYWDLAGGTGRVRVALSPAVVQEAFSGAPVFTRRGELLGIIVERCRWMEPPNGAPSFYTIPLMSPVDSLRDEILRLVQPNKRLQRTAAKRPETRRHRGQ